MARSASPLLAGLLSACNATDAPRASVDDALPVPVRMAVRATESEQALIRGRLVLDQHGCFRLGERGAMLVWHHDTRIGREPDGRFVVYEGFTGMPLAVGDEVALSGSGIENVPAAMTTAIPEACLGDPYWNAGPPLREQQGPPVPLPPPGPDEAAPGTSPVLARSQDTSGIHGLAPLEGRLYMDRHGCLRVATGVHRPVVIWHRDTHIEYDGDRIAVRDGFSGHVAIVGARVRMAGAHRSAAPEDDVPGVPAACRSTAYWFAGPLDAATHQARSEY